MRTQNFVKISSGSVFHDLDGSRKYLETLPIFQNIVASLSILPIRSSLRVHYYLSSSNEIIVKLLLQISRRVLVTSNACSNLSFCLGPEGPVQYSTIYVLYEVRPIPENNLE